MYERSVRRARTALADRDEPHDARLAVDDGSERSADGAEHLRSAAPVRLDEPRREQGRARLDDAMRPFAPRQASTTTTRDESSVWSTLTSSVATTRSSARSPSRFARSVS